MIGKWDPPLPYIFANDYFTLSSYNIRMFYGCWGLRKSDNMPKYYKIGLYTLLLLSGSVKGETK